MNKRNYWLTVFTATTWQEFLESGTETAGFPEGRWKTVQKIKQGDYLICYLARVSRWIGVLEVISEPFIESSPIWKHGSFPCRIKTKIIVNLTPETGIPVLELKDKISIFSNLRKPNSWAAHFRISPKEWKHQDGEVVVQSLFNAKENPIIRPVDISKLTMR